MSSEKRRFEEWLQTQQQNCLAVLGYDVDPVDYNTHCYKNN